MNAHFENKVRMIPVKQIHVLNPRGRGKRKFGQIISNIANLGLKKPITVTLVSGSNGDALYHLVCGQGRLEAFIALGQEEIPAIVVEGTKEDLLLMGLTENLARRRPTSVALLREISSLKERGYSHSEIAKKTDLHLNYVKGILQLLLNGEERLLMAVERGELPLGIAITIATSDDKGVQRALQEAYEKNDLRGKDLLRARRLIENRRSRGKRVHSPGRKAAEKPVTSNDLLRTFQRETMKQKMVIQKAKICETRLRFAVSALKQLFQDENFVTLLRAEGLDTLPQYLADQISNSEVSHDGTSAIGM
ncbi:plasmid partitioning protein RepB C-terminal domain-containing protein [Anatilimnocola sp. NA78]|uniref:plasmid partitioning protein RepB C-terminal domain-containing protein n=1 Tax=Anatilimnocola sp. NA78 TaxID=3415683 RepID=UPI003CE469E1